MLLSCAALTIHLASTHFPRGDTKYREENLGIGMSCAGVRVGAYKNSEYRTTLYVGKDYFWCWRAVCGGAIMMAATGYDSGVKVFPLPTVTIGSGSKVALSGLPRIGDRDGFVGLSVEIPLRGK